MISLKIYKSIPSPHFFSDNGNHFQTHMIHGTDGNSYKSNTQIPSILLQIATMLQSPCWIPPLWVVPWRTHDSPPLKKHVVFLFRASTFWLKKQRSHRAGYEARKAPPSWRFVRWSIHGFKDGHLGILYVWWVSHNKLYWSVHCGIAFAHVSRWRKNEESGNLIQFLYILLLICTWNPKQPCINVVSLGCFQIFTKEMAVSPNIHFNLVAWGSRHVKVPNGICWTNFSRCFPRFLDTPSFAGTYLTLNDGDNWARKKNLFLS